MKTSLIILLCKLIRLVGKAVGKGSSLPGQIALKLDPNILQKIKLPKEIIAVTGSHSGNDRPCAEKQRQKSGL